MFAEPAQRSLDNKPQERAFSAVSNSGGTSTSAPGMHDVPIYQLTHITSSTQHAPQFADGLTSLECGAGGLGLIPKPLAKSIAHMLGSGMMTDNGPAAASKSSLAMVPEAEEDEDE